MATNVTDEIISWPDEDTLPRVYGAPLENVFCRGVMPSSSTPPSFFGAGFKSLGAVSDVPQNSSTSAGQEAAETRPKISELNEWAQKRGKTLQWNVSKPSTGSSYFSASVLIDGDEENICLGAGPTKKIAKHAAATAACSRLFPSVVEGLTEELTNIELQAATAHSCESLEQAVGKMDSSSIPIPRILFAYPAQLIIQDLLPLQSFSYSEKKAVEARLMRFQMKASHENSPPTAHQKAAAHRHQSVTLIDALNQKFKSIEKATWGQTKEKIAAGSQHAEPTLPHDRPFVARLDGRSFSSRFKKGTLVTGSSNTFQRPYDQRIHGAFCAAAADCLDKFPTAAVAYTQSDEITIVFLPAASEVTKCEDQSETERETRNNKHPFQGRVGKLVSLLAATVSVSFNRHLANMCVAEATTSDQQLSSQPDALPFKNKVSDMIFTFDCRVFPVLSQAEAVECCIWRCIDARRNSVSMMFYHWKSKKEVRFDDHNSSGISTETMLRLLARAGISWLDTPNAFRHGSWVVPASRTCRANSSGGVLAGVFQMPEVMLPVSDTLVQRVLFDTVF